MKIKITKAVPKIEEGEKENISPLKPSKVTDKQLKGTIDKIIKELKEIQENVYEKFKGILKNKIR